MDYSDDLKTLESFVTEFETIYLTKLGLTVLKDITPMDYIKRGAEKIYTLPKPKNPIETKLVSSIGNGMLWLTSDINPNGVTDSTDIARTYTIKFQVMCKSRRKFTRLDSWYDDCYLQFYSYGRTIEEILNKFNCFVESDKFNEIYLK